MGKAVSGKWARENELCFISALLHET